MDVPAEKIENVQAAAEDSDAGATVTSSTSRVRRRPTRLVAIAVAALMLAAGIGGYTFASASQSGPASLQSTAAASGTTNSGSATTTLTLAQIEAAVAPTIVDVTSTIGSSGTAKGTGMVISSTGEILTNNHVVSGATSIRVQIAGTGRTYSATLVGYDVSADIAVLQIANVSGLETIQTASASTVSVNEAVVAIGNALGEGGTPAAVQGVVAAVDQTITASDSTGSSTETLTGLIEISAAVEPGDSGGATVNASGQVLGMTTAAATSRFQPMSTSSTTMAYAIPIDTALSVARQIESGTASETVHIGQHGLLGVQADDTYGSGVHVVAVESGSAAARAGLGGGDSIVSINGRTINSTSDLDTAMATTHVGDRVTIVWHDTAGQSHETAATLSTGVA